MLDVVLSHCGFDLHLPNDIEYFHVHIFYPYVLFDKVLVQVIWPFFN